MTSLFKSINKKTHLELDIICQRKNITPQKGYSKKTKIALIQGQLVQPVRGSGCSKSGASYEAQISNLLRTTRLQGVPFHTQSVEELGGSSAKNDLYCHFQDRLIGIEVKKGHAPDWMQFSLKYNGTHWSCSEKSQNPEACRAIMNVHIKPLEMAVPPFMEKEFTHKEWLDLKQRTTEWSDRYQTIPNDIITELYRAKGCHYIQISSHGLYHLGEDLCGFNVPLFHPEGVQLRIRTKIHTRSNTKGFCSLSLIASPQPIKIQASPYSLDALERLPVNLSRGRE
jgi:hypothetical protein